MATDCSDPRAALRAYDLGPVHRIALAGGTAGRTWKVSAAGGEYFLRLRGVRTSAETRLEFDHGLRAHLVAHGVPTAAALTARDGGRWLRRPEGVYELYPWVAGRPFDPHHIRELAHAARALARFHQVAAQYCPPAGPREQFAQYTTLGFSQATSDRLDDPALQQENLRAVRGLAETPQKQALVERCLARAAQLQHGYAGAAAPLAGWVIHGDYTPANLLFSELGQVKGIFDLDWASPGARCRDVADGLYFFAARPRRIDAADIWSLTDAAQFDPDRCLIFLRAYQEIAPLSAAELDALPLAFAGRWLSIRLEGMAKVSAAQRFLFFSRDIEAPLQWLDHHWEPLRSQLV